MTWGGKNGHCYGYDGDAFKFYWWFVGWDCLSIGLHVCVSAPNVEVHCPFGFFRIGRRPKPKPAIITLPDDMVERLLAEIEPRYRVTNPADVL